MSDLNKVFLVGRLGADPEIRYSNNGQPWARLRLATSEKFKNKNGELKEKTQWHRVTCFGQQAEFAGQAFGKGSLILVEGSIEYSEGEKDGQKTYFTDIKAFRVQALETKGSRAASPANEPPPPGDDTPGDDLPF